MLSLKSQVWTGVVQDGQWKPISSMIHVGGGQGGSDAEIKKKQEAGN
jgi:hypothetical protein